MLIIHLNLVYVDEVKQISHLYGGIDIGKLSFIPSSGLLHIIGGTEWDKRRMKNHCVTASNLIINRGFMSSVNVCYLS